MNLDLIFRLANNAALIGWLILILLPRWRWSARLVAPVLVPSLLAVVYCLLVATQFGHSPGGFSSLASVALLFRNQKMLLAGWVHYLAFDLFVGSWEVRDAQRIGIAHYLVIPCLILTFLFGPIGWLLYTLIRSAARRIVGVDLHEGSGELSADFTNGCEDGQNDKVGTSMAMSLDGHAEDE